ncbi:putative alkylated DNA repair protein AlkB [Helianthus annuus]|nr:putative alkylated DNA repair protein AlkB [Helianthus annuus]
MYGSDSVNDDSERTAFRKTEKKYKLYYDSTSKSSKKKKQPRPVDLSEVIDFKAVSESFDRNGDLRAGVSKLECPFDRPVFCLDDCPGMQTVLTGCCAFELEKINLRELELVLE